jgi:hypothetical protein
MAKATQTTGKQGELMVIGELLKRGFDVYLPAVDIGGIDCIIKTDIDYKEIQVKTRERYRRSPLFAVKKFIPRENFFIICYDLNDPKTFWVIPSKKFKELAKEGKTGYFRLDFGGEYSEIRKKLHIYQNNFFQLLEGSHEARRELRNVEKVIQKTGWQWMKERYPTLDDVNRKIREAKEKGYSKGYIKVLENLKKYWKKHK